MVPVCGGGRVEVEVVVVATVEMVVCGGPGNGRMEKSPKINLFFR